MPPRKGMKYNPQRQAERFEVRLCPICKNAWEPVDFGNGKPAKAWDKYYDFPKISIKIVKICPECRR